MNPMLYLPFVTIAEDDVFAHVLLGENDDRDALVGLDPLDGEVYEFEPSAIVSLVSIDPTAVFFGYQADWREQPMAMVANPPRGHVPRYLAKGAKFPVLPAGTLSGYPVAAKVIRRFRASAPSEDAVRKSLLFALSTVRVGIEQAEESFSCFEDLYRQVGDMPSAALIKRCFRGLANTKATQFIEATAYVPTIQRAIESGLRDRELRRHLCLETEMPRGVGLAKLSFTLALLGQNTVCLDARLLTRMFPDPARRASVDRQFQKTGRSYTQLSLSRYEALEDAFLKGNPHYDASDPLGAARAQWMSWESVGGRGATHSTWMKAVSRVR